MSEKLLSTGECAALLGLSRQAVTNAVRRGEIKAVRTGRTYVVTQAACEAYRPMKDLSEQGRYAVSARWAGHEKPEKPKRGRGRPRKNAPTGEAGSGDEETL